MIITDEKLLRLPCENVKVEEVGPFIDQLERELKHSGELGNKGIGLSAPQINYKKRIAIVRVNKEYSVNLVNPKIIIGYDKSLFDGEGCLSYPGRYETTMRYQEIVVENDIEPYKFIATGLFGICIQHEIGHLNGVLLPDVAITKTVSKKVRPNDTCPCNSGRKYKKCCGLI